MPKLPDNHVLADRVMLLLRTTYREWKGADEPFNHAFMSLMDKYDVAGDARYPLKQAIGAILAKRPRRTSKKHADKDPLARPTQKLTFAVIQKSTARVILKCDSTSDEVTYVSQNGQVRCSAHSGSPSSDMLAEGRAYAEEIFAQMEPRVAPPNEIQVVHKLGEKLTMRISGKYDALFVRGKRASVCMMVVLGTEEVPQKEIQIDTLRKARKIAKEYFRDTHTLDLFTTRA